MIVLGYIAAFCMGGFITLIFTSSSRTVHDSYEHVYSKIGEFYVEGRPYNYTPTPTKWKTLWYQLYCEKCGRTKEIESKQVIYE